MRWLQMGQEQRAKQVRDDSNAIKKLGFEFMPSYTGLAAVPARFALASADSAVSEAAIRAEAWPVCSTMRSMVETADWAALDPDFAAGKRAMVAGDWNGAINAFRSAGLRDARNADIQNYLGYSYRRLQQLDRAMQHYQQALAITPRHRSAHEHLGEAYLVQGDLAKAEEHLTALERICLIPCDEYDDLKQAIGAKQHIR
jgi:Flp pilus assembly protein TadD